MSDNEGNVFDDDEDIAGFREAQKGTVDHGSDDDFKRAVQKETPPQSNQRRRIYVTRSADKERLKELVHVHKWADISRHHVIRTHDLSSLDAQTHSSWRNLLWTRTKHETSVKLPSANLYAAAVSIASNGWHFEHLVVFSLALTLAVVISVVPPTGPRLASQLDFHYLVTTLVYVVTFGAQQTLGRRDNTLRYMTAVKTLLCQTALALLLWNRDRVRPGPDGNFSERVVALFQKGTYHIFTPLLIPTWNRTRHYFTREGLAFRRAMRKRIARHRLGFTRFQVDLHLLFEEMKEVNAIETHETTRLTDYARVLQVYSEQLVLVKEYRTTNVARSFVRVFLLMCPPMYAVYFSFVAGNLTTVAPGGASLMFSILLCIASLMLVLLLVNVDRAMEDPCTTDFKVERIDVREELHDMYERIALLADYCRSKQDFREGELRMDENEEEEDEEEVLREVLEEDETGVALVEPDVPLS